MSKPLPKMTSDQDAEKLLEEDLTEYLTPDNFKENFKPVTFEFAPKDATISLRLSKDLLEAVKKVSGKQGIGYQKFIRQSIERAIREA